MMVCGKIIARRSAAEIDQLATSWLPPVSGVANGDRRRHCC